MVCKITSKTVLPQIVTALNIRKQYNEELFEFIQKYVGDTALWLNKYAL